MSSFTCATGAVLVRVEDVVSVKRSNGLMNELTKGLFTLHQFCCDLQLMQSVAVKIEKIQLMQCTALVAGCSRIAVV